jgi:hypothetical protein
MRKPRKPIPRGAPPVRRKPLKRSTRGIAPRKADKSKRRFQSLRDEAYQGWVRQHLCVLLSRDLHRCDGEIQCCHLRSRGAGGADRGNCFPACANAHRQQHLLGIKTFQEIWDLDLKVIAAHIDAQYVAAGRGSEEGAAE